MRESACKQADQMLQAQHSGGQVQNKAVCPGFMPIDEWIDYWKPDSTQHESDKLHVDEMRSDLAWASQAISHMLATLRNIADSECGDGKQHAMHCLAEYGVNDD